jgi:hypothetical protein
MSGPLEFFVTDDPDRTWAEIEPHVKYRWESYNRYMFEGTSKEAQRSAYYDVDAIRGFFLLGPPEEVAEGIRKRTDGLPVTDLFGWCDFPGLPDAAVDRHIELTFTQLATLLA